MGIVGKPPFSWRAWICVAAAAGFLAVLVLVISLYVVVLRDWATPLQPFAVREAGLLFLSALLSLPALFQQILMRQSGLRARLYYPATIIGGWVLLTGIVEGFRLDTKGYEILGMELEPVISLGSVLLGCVLVAFLQSLTLPRSGRRFYFLIGAPGAIGGLAVALGVLAVLVPRTGDLFGIPAIGFAIGWSCFATATGWPIRRAIERMR